MEIGKNYPIKYALLPVYEHKGFIAGVDGIMPSFEITAYVVSKCFVFEERTRYYGDGKSVPAFKVVFPYRTIDSLNKQMNVPNIVGDDCFNSTLVHEVYEDYDQAKQSCNHLNSLYTFKALHQEGLAEDEKEIIMEQESKRLERVQEFEDQIAEATKELAIGKQRFPRKDLNIF